MSSLSTDSTIIERHLVVVSNFRKMRDPLMRGTRSRPLRVHIGPFEGFKAFFDRLQLLEQPCTVAQKLRTAWLLSRAAALLHPKLFYIFLLDTLEKHSFT
jgi:hypothetical protein